jgi:NADH-quinone oxidoreductase subunit G
LIGCDLTEEYPVLWLRLKAAIDRGARLIIVHPSRPEIRGYAAHVLTPPPDAIARTLASLPAAVAAAVAGGQRVHVFLGRLALDGAGGPAALRAARGLAEHGRATLHVLRGRGNDIGAQRYGLIPSAGGWTAPEVLRRAAAGEIDVLYVAGADPASDATDRAAWEAARGGAGCLIVQDAFLSETARSADIVLPALVMPEKGGTVTNLEGRTLPLSPAVAGPGQARPDLEIFSRLAERLGHIMAPGTADESLAALRAVAGDVAVGAVTPIRPVGEIDGEPGTGSEAGSAPPAGGPDGGGLRVLIVDRLFTQGVMTGRSRGIRDLAGAPRALLNAADATALEIPDGTLVEVRTAHGAVIVPARVSDEAPRGVVLLPRGFDAVPVHALVRWPDLSAPATVRVPAPAGELR